MTSENEVLKTNEFLRRRKLRLQQVREQSKDIAKKIRQRAKVEKLRQVVDLDAKKHNEYLQRQEELVKQLEHFYAKGIKSVGASHRRACEQRQDVQPEKTDLSKLRGKEAAAELKRQKQEKLDEQKKILDRKLQAREAANEKSREKSAAISNKVQLKPTNKEIEDAQNKATMLDALPAKDNENILEVDNNKAELTRNDMATQWEESMPQEWEPNVPKLALPKQDDIKDYNLETKSDKSKRLNLFALSEEMPSSLRGSNIHHPEERIPVKSSLTLVSEYLQNRGLRLRESDTSSSKKNVDDLYSLKQTILHTRTSKPPSGTSNLCQVVDEQLVPVPSWQAEVNCEFCAHDGPQHEHYTSRQYKNITNSQINKIFSSIRPRNQDLLPSPILRGTSPFRRNKVCQKTFPGRGSNIEKSAKSTAPNSALTKKNSVTMYNHSTRDSRDIPYHDEGLVMRDLQTDEDAYSQAMKEASIDNFKDKEHHKKIQDMRNKIAMSKHAVEKEYKDTMTFLNSLPKDGGNKPIKNAYLDDRRQQIQKEIRQQKLQQEYKKIEKECRKHTCRNKIRTMSKSPIIVNEDDDDVDSNDFQYSWMPVPEGDGNFAVHTIPTSFKEGKAGNTVKFSKVDSYHEYRSRHRHTPPTKDTGGHEKLTKRIEAVIVQNNSSDSIDTLVSDSSSGENISLEKNNKNIKNKEPRLSDAERIIIYKILDSKHDKKTKKAKLVKNIAKSLTSIENIDKSTNDDNNNEPVKKKPGNIRKDVENKLSYEEINEGIYKGVSENGLSYNVMSCYTTNIELWQNTADRKPWWDNIASMYYSDHPQTGDKGSCIEEENDLPCCHNHKYRKDQQNKKVAHPQWQCSDTPSGERLPKSCTDCKCGCNSAKQKDSDTILTNQPSAGTSTTSFKTATNDKGNNSLPLTSYIKLMDAAGQEAGNFYIGASGFLKDDAYEVVFQLRKKEAAKGDDDKVGRNDFAEENVRSQEKITEQLPETDAVAEASVSKKGKDECKNLTDPVSKDKKSYPKQDLITLNVASHVPINENVNENLLGGSESSGVVISSHSNEASNLVDKGVYKTFKDTYAIPSDDPKSDPVLKPATSTYTQTTPNSPNHRPVYFHMSSSTSTAYMSPPEMILPKFLKHGYHLTHDDDPINFNMQEKIEITEQEGYCEEYADCKCLRCMRARKITINKTTPIHCCKKGKHSRKKTAETPPNTARTCNTDDMNDIYKDKKDSANVVSKKPKCKCHKCELHARSNASLKSHNYRNITNMPASKQSSQNVKRVTSSTASCRKVFRANSNFEKSNKINLNPVIEKYVNKLLSLNKESLKAVEVIDQECSSVATPGSSIINVPYNIVGDEAGVDHKISLEQIKNILRQQIIACLQKKEHSLIESSDTCTRYDVIKPTKTTRIPRKQSVHKVKSFNISKHLIKSKTSADSKQMLKTPASSSSSPKEESIKTPLSIPPRAKLRSKSSPTPREIRKNTSLGILTTKNTVKDKKVTDYNTNSVENKKPSSVFKQKPQPISIESYTLPSHRATTTSTSPESESTTVSLPRQKIEIPINTSTQTNENVNGEINFMKLAEDKLQNMEKIADLTEKCTKRLSNIAKVLEEVRKHKSLAYSQISTSDSMSDIDQKSEKNVGAPNRPTQLPDTISDNQIGSASKSPLQLATTEESNEKRSDSTDFVPFLTDIPKPSAFNAPDCDLLSNSSEKSNHDSATEANIETLGTKNRGKPPPALSRMHLKLGQEFVTPHELSTVIEVDSPMSMKYKNQSARNDTKNDVPDGSNPTTTENNDDRKKEESYAETSTSKNPYFNPDLLQGNGNLSKRLAKISATESSDDSKVQMIDLKQFNEIMLKPFFSIDEYAKQCNIASLDEGSNLEDIPKDPIVDELSSLHSDGSLPDVIAELLKRNIINEPFKFDFGSNVNSTTISSESTLSMLALSQARKEKKKSSVMFQNKENNGETTDTLSFSSNPDLENAFKKLGMGWASSTLKKTKERLALSSSSNTSSSSLSQFKKKTIYNQDIPVLVTDSVSSVLNLSKKPFQTRNSSDNSKNAGQQTSLTNSMTVKEFLNNELAKKITFTNKSRNDTEEEFVSLFETKMPENFKHSSQMIREERSIDGSVQSANNNRARTSTPVQLFKSMTYHSSSSSNMSNALFSNADDLSSVKVTSNSMKHSTSDKDDLTIPNFSLKMKKGSSDCSKSD